MDNILEVGGLDRAAAGLGAANQYATYVEEVGGIITILNLRSHKDGDINKKVYNIVIKYFRCSEEADVGTGPASVGSSGTFAVSPGKYLS